MQSETLPETLKRLHPFITCEGADSMSRGKVVFRFDTLEHAQEFHAEIIKLVTV